VVNTVIAQETKDAAPLPAATLLKNKPKLVTPDQEVKDAIVFLEENFKSEEDKKYIRFFTTYAEQDEKSREDLALILSFICHSLTGAVTKDFQGGGFYPLARRTEDGKFEALRKVPGSDTLWWVDIREFNWTEKAWESMSTEDGYFVEPIVTHDANSLLRLISGNAVVRADWFIVHASDLTKQSDTGSKVKIYKEFLYGTLDKIPTTVKEFETAWSIDTAKAAEIGNIFGVVVTKSKAVSRHNRTLIGYETELGWYYRSYDVKFMRGLRDYGDAILDFKGGPPTVFDGGEIFATNFMKLQVYDLYNDKEELADFADPTLVRHITDVTADARVRTPIGCFDCHAAGPIPSENSLKELLQSKAKAYISDQDTYLRTKRVYLDGRFEDSIEEHQLLFEKALSKVNGLKPDENAKAYLSIVSKYNQGITLEQAAFECGLEPAEFIRGLSKENKIEENKVPFRLALLLSNKEAIPREVWEHPGQDGRPGLFQQSMILINGLTQIVKEDVAIEVETVKVIDYVVKKQTYIYTSPNSNTIAVNQMLKVGEKVKKSKTDSTVEGWLGVEYNGKNGFIKSEDVEK